MRKSLAAPPYALLAVVIPFTLALSVLLAPTASAAPIAPAAPAPLTIVTPLTVTPLAPEASTGVVTATFAVRNDGAQPLFLYHLGAGGRGPSCTDFKCGEIENFELAADVTLAPGETYTYTQQRIFLKEGTHFFEIVYETVPTEWQFLGDRVDMTVQPGLRLSAPLTLSPNNPARSAAVTAEFQLTNGGTQPFSTTTLVVGARGPNCVPADWSCTSRPDFEQVDSFTLAPGKVYDYRASRSFTENGTYFFQVFFINALGQWEPVGDRLQFTVSEIGGVGTESLYLPLIKP
ncbi:MAG: hypothetical protein U0X20_10975 [Caldilineaceae bacterium]